MNTSIIYWIMYFYIYCFLGWCIESAIVSADTKKLTNRGFLRGPMLPIYGFGAIMILFCTLPFGSNIFLQYMVGAAACTVLEYVTGVLMEAIFKTKYWDYTGKFMNFQGRICLVSSLFWGVLSLFVIYVIHDPISAFVTKHISLPAAIVIVSVISAAFLTDVYFSAKAAFMLTKIVRVLEEVNVQLELAKMEAREKLSLSAEEFRDRMGDMSDSFRDMGEEFSRRIDELRRRRSDVLKNAGFSVRSLVKNNPTALHKQFVEGFSELKDYVKRFRKQN